MRGWWVGNCLWWWRKSFFLRKSSVWKKINTVQTTSKSTNEYPHIEIIAQQLLSHLPLQFNNNNSFHLASNSGIPRVCHAIQGARDEPEECLRWRLLTLTTQVCRITWNFSGRIIQWIGELSYFAGTNFSIRDDCLCLLETKFCDSLFKMRKHILFCQFSLLVVLRWCHNDTQRDFSVEGIRYSLLEEYYETRKIFVLIIC